MRSRICRSMALAISASCRMKRPENSSPTANPGRAASCRSKCLGDVDFMPHEETGKFIADGNTRPGGKLPLNTNGGGLSYMHSGMYGMYALQESVKQMRGSAAAQVPNAKISVCHGAGGMVAASGTITFSNEER